MELQWLSFLVVTIMVSNSTQIHHDTPQDNNSQKKGNLKVKKMPQFENTHPPSPLIRYQQLANQYQPLPYQYQPLPYQYQPLANQYPPLTYTEINKDNLQPLRDQRLYQLLKQQQQQDARKLRKVMLTLKTALPQLMKLLQNDVEPSHFPIFPVKETR